MASFNGKGRNQDWKARRGRLGRRGAPLMEALEQRMMLDGGGGNDIQPTWKPTSNDIYDVKSGPLALEGPELIGIYKEYNAYFGAGNSGPFVSAKYKSLVRIQGDFVGIDAHGWGDLGTFVTSLKSLGMQVEQTSAQYNVVEGLFPISQLQNLAQLPQIVNVSPIYRPILETQGVAANQGDKVFKTDAARTQFGVNGRGVTVGVLSDSVSQFQGGLADSVRTGDLPNNVTVLQDLPGGGGTDEGRAMLEQIYDIAPGATLAFATGGGGPLNFASNITALANFGAQVIVDDLKYANEPMFQDGIIAQAVTSAAATKNVVYMSSAGNYADHGYESQWRGVSTTIAGVTGKFMNFNPGNGAAVTQLPVTINAGGTIVFQYDNPFYKTNGVTSDLDILILDANNNIVAQGNSNNIATNTPLEVFTSPGPGSYTVAVVVKAGPDVGRIRFQQLGGGPDIRFDKSFGTAGGTSYPTTFGHAVSNEAFGVGAVPWFGAPPYANPSPIVTEDFSSAGPVNILFDASGNRLPAIDHRLKPDFTAPDGVNTSFFGQTGAIPPGFADNNYSLPNFFGTSSAAPNLAALTALMKQLSPSSTLADIKSAYLSSATPLNGAAAGQWQLSAGYGLPDAVKALAAIDNLRIASMTPGSGSTVTTTPSAITVTFTKPINFTTVTASDLNITAPAGTTVTVGKPIPVNDPNFPTIVRFPITITRNTNASSNGTYTASFAAGSVTSKDNKALVAFTDSFVLQDKTAPKLTSTSVTGRTVKFVFSEGLDPATVNLSNIQIIRAGKGPQNQDGLIPNPANVIVTNDPRVVITYDPVTFTVSVDLSALPQTFLPTDRYLLVAKSPTFDSSGNQLTPGLTDQVGNALDGEFSGQFPTGNNTAGGQFNQDLGVVTLAPPLFNRLSLDPAQHFDPASNKLVPGSSDTGIPSDQNTKDQRPVISGTIGSSFPGTSAGLLVLIQYNGLHQGNLDLATGFGGRGYVGTYDAITTTDANGNFVLVPPSNLPDGFNKVRLVVVGEPDQPPLPGMSTQIDYTFRVDTSLPTMDTSGSHPSGASLPQNTSISSLSTVTLFITDPVNFADTVPGNHNASAFAVPPQLSFFALDPASATNVSNYKLINLGPDRQAGTPDDIDESAFIKGAAFASTSNRQNPDDPYTGNVVLTFTPGLPKGLYNLVALANAITGQGVKDSAGNLLAGDPSKPTTINDFTLTFDYQPEPVFITSVKAKVSDTDATDYDIRSFFEVPTPGTTPRGQAPPTVWNIDFSSSLPDAVDYTDMVQLIATADQVAGTPDGDFGNFGSAAVDNNPGFGQGFSRVPGTSVTVTSSVPGAQPGEPGYNNRLVLRLADNTVLTPDNYRLYIPNTKANIIRDVFGNQLDGEFRANKTPDGSSYEVLQPNGQYRPGLSGDSIQGGSFVTGYTVVATGNILYAKPDYIDDPFNNADDPDGSLAKPFPALAPEAVPNGTNGGDLNSQNNFGTGFNPALDRNGDGFFTRSVFVEAQKRAQFGPVVVVALPGTIVRNPFTGNTSQATFVLQAPSGTDTFLNDGSAAIPEMTTLVFDTGSTLKLQNASLFVQNQGSALQLRGGSATASQVTITSFKDDSVAGDTNKDNSDSTPLGGDWGGVVYRNYDQTDRNATFPGQIPTTGDPLVDGRLKGPGGADAVSGSDDVMSYIDNATLRYGGGAVPLTIGTRYDQITLVNARTSVTNSSISLAGGPTGAQAGLSANFDSFREDQILRGPIFRRDTIKNNSINGIYVPAELNGVVQPTDAMPYPSNPNSYGGVQNYAFEAPYPFVFAARAVVGSLFLQETAGQTTTFGDRLYIQPGSVLKFQRGAALETYRVGGATQASINIGDRTYVAQWDLNHNLSPSSANFRPQTIGDAPVLFTSFFDDNGTTSFFDPVTQISTPIVEAMDSDNGGSALQPTGSLVDPLARWGNIAIGAGTLAIVDEAEIRYGAGTVNTLSGTANAPAALAFRGADTTSFGTHAYITNNNIHDNLVAAMSVEPDGLLAGDAQRPLVSGHPFFRGNIFQNNERNGLEVLSSLLPPGTIGVGGNWFTQSVSTVWDSTDIPYLLRSTIVLAGDNAPPTGSANTLDPIPAPSISLTIQSALPDTILANGEKIARPGESALIKLLNALAPLGDGVAGQPTGNITANNQFGAGFAVGFDNGVDPTADSLIDEGVNSQIRIIGIGGNETTGQLRVPVIITSMRDDSVGKVVRNVNLNVAIGGNTTAPAPGDGGVIMFGGQQLTDFNLYDPRDGSIIDNADIKYMTRIEQVGRVLYRTYDTNGDGSYAPGPDGWQRNKAGLALPGIGFANQFNQPNAMTVSNSNFANFSQTGFLAHPGIGSIVLPQNYPAAPGRVGDLGGPTNTYFINNTFSNMPVAIRVNSETQNNTAFPTPAQVVVLNNTFYNNGVGFHTQAIPYNGLNSLSHVFFIAMNNIFANSSIAAAEINGQATNSQFQYNLFDANAANVVLTQADFFSGNLQPVFGQALFRNAAAGDFNLQPNSAAVDASRSEIGPLLIGNMLNPAVTQQLNASVGIRNQTGRINWPGGLGGGATNLDVVTLPGYPIRTFKDQWVAVLQGTPGSFTGTATTAGETYAWLPIAGERDSLGFFRQDYPGKANVGFGSRPFFDIGAFEYRQLFPPHIIDVQATFKDTASNSGLTTSTIYKVGGIAGTNKSPESIGVVFDSRLDTATINNQTVLLDASGGDGIFGNGNSAADRTIDLSGKLAFDQVTKILTINLAASGLVLSNDEYRIRVLGNGSNVIRDQNGNALDGENLDVNGAQRALPSGDGFPGGNFVVTFTIDTNKPSVINGTFKLDPSSDSNLADNITNNSLPSFSGDITDVFPPTNFLQGQTVILDISSKGDGVYDLANAGTAITDASGHFVVTSSLQVPDTNYNVGPDGILHTADDGYYARARIRVIDQSGNVSLLPTDSDTAFNNAGALTAFVVDTHGPRITSFSPTDNSLASLNNGLVPISVGFNENVDPASLNSGSIKVVRSGGDGIFGNGNDVPLTIDPASIKITYLKTVQGAVLVTFNVTGNFANDVYNVTVSGTSSPVIDIAGNALDGEYTGTFPTGNGVSGGDFNSNFVVYDPALIHKLFVGTNVTDPAATQGSRANPYPTIAQGLNNALTGDVVAVLPGVYTEQVTLKSLVSLVSADLSSTDAFLVNGDPLKTVIRAPQSIAGTTSLSTIVGSDLLSVQGGNSLNTELRGFTVASPLFGDPATGTILPDSIALQLTNSDLLINRNYFIDASVGVAVALTGAGARTPRFVNDVFNGNTLGLLIHDAGGSVPSVTAPVTITNSDFVFNDVGFDLNVGSGAPLMAVATNNIFWQNHSLQLSRTGAAINATAAGKLRLINNLFSGNGPSQDSPADDTNGVGGGFDPSVLSSSPDGSGNIQGDPKFVQPRDARPSADGPGVFFNDANFDLTRTSAAVDRGFDSSAPTLDFLYRARRLVTGPSLSDIGAFEYQGVGGSPVGGQEFRVVTTSFSADGSPRAASASVPSSAAPKYVDVVFSENLDRASVTPSDLVVSGNGLASSNPARPTSLTWIDDHTVRFNLEGGYGQSGTVRIDLYQNSVKDRLGQGVSGMGDSINLVPPAPAPNPNPAPGPNPNPNPAPAPPPVQPITTIVNAVADVKKGYLNNIILMADGDFNAAVAGNAGNYILRAAGRDKKLGTKDDVIVRIGKATVVGRAIVLFPKKKLALTGNYQLEILNLVDTQNRQLGRANNGVVKGIVTKWGTVALL